MPDILISGLALFRGVSLQAWILQILAVLFALSVHEAAHAWVADRLGDGTAREAGRVSLNPLVHLDPIGSLFILMGAPVGWAKPVPFNPNRFDRRWTVKQGIALVSIAGVTANIIVAFISRLLVVGAQLWWFSLTLRGANDSTLGQVVFVIAEFFTILFYINLYLTVFNLLPVPPLDGFKFFGTVLPNRIYYTLMQYERYIGMAFFAILIFGRGLLTNILQTLATPLIWVIDTPLRALFRLLVGALFGVQVG